MTSRRWRVAIVGEGLEGIGFVRNRKKRGGAGVKTEYASMREPEGFVVGDNVRDGESRCDDRRGW